MSYAFCSDTMYKPSIVPLIKNVDLLYHESTFLNDKIDLTHHTKHSTAQQAAQIASQAEIAQLVLGHFSSRYTDLDLFIEEAQTVFKNVQLAKEGKVFQIEAKMHQELTIAQHN